ncbi:MAG: hypothetical protein RSE91_00165 [Bacilli bacterium]
MQNNSSKQVLLSVLGVAILVVAVVGVSFAAFTWASTDTTENKISTGTLTMIYTAKTNGINITDAMPTTDDAGIAVKDASDTKSNKTFKFTVGATINGAATINYDLGLAKNNTTNALADTDVHMYLATLNVNTETAVKTAAGVDAKGVFTFKQNSAPSVNGVPATSMTIATGSFNATGTKDYILKMWLKDTYAFASGDVAKTYSVTVNAYAKAA